MQTCTPLGDLQTTLAYAANVASPHIQRWLTVSGSIKPDIVLDATLKSIPSYISVPVEFGINRTYMGFSTSTLSYAVAGIMLRRRYKKSLTTKKTLLHVHSAGGYGVIASALGCPYVLGVYGTEINSYPKADMIRRYLIRKTVTHAIRIHAYSDAMAQRLTQLFRVPRERVFVANLGIEAAHWQLTQDEQVRSRRKLGIGENSLVFFVNRRIHPYYETKEVLGAFAEFAKGRSSVNLVLLEGQSDRKYVESIMSEVEGDSRVTLVRGFVDQPTMKSLYAAADFCISFPLTDEFSAAVVQAMVCGCVPILRNGLDAYDILPGDLVIRCSRPELKRTFEQIYENGRAFYRAQKARNKDFALHSLIERDLGVRINGEFYGPAFVELSFHRNDA